MAIISNISYLTVERLSCYLRALREFGNEGKVSVSSVEIAERVGSASAQVRKDLSYFGSFGVKGRGYKVDELIEKIKEIMGLNRIWKVALVGYGRLGESLAQYKRFKESGFDIVAIFEKDKTKIGKKYLGVPVYSVDKMPEICEKLTILISVIAVPPDFAYDAIQSSLDAGIRAILNFSGQGGFKPPPHAMIKDMNLAAELEALSYFITHPIKIKQAEKDLDY